MYVVLQQFSLGHNDTNRNFGGFSSVGGCLIGLVRFAHVR